MNETVTKKTQDTLGKVIKKPPLTQKLLSRPPFRFLHDIFTEVIRTTGFMKGLYVESELKADNVKDKESKMAFLQRAIDVVMLVSGEPLAAKPGYIVAGHEPEKTNELLQAIAKCCLNKMSSDDAVKRVLAGEKVDTKTKASTSRSQDKENREGGERLDREEKKKIIEHSGSKTQKAPDQPKEQESRHRHGEKEHHRESDRSAKHHRSEQDHHANDRDRDKRADRDHHAKDSERNKRRDRDHHAKDRDKDERRDRDRDRHKEEGRAKERDKEKDRERDREKEKDKEKDRERDREKEKDKEKDRERDREKEKDKEKDRERDREKEKDKEKDRQRDREKEKDKKRDRERTRERDSDRNRERDKEKRRDRDKEQEKQIEQRKEDGESNKTENGNIKARVSEKTPSPEETSKTTKPLPASDGPARIPRPSSAKGQRRRPNIGNQAESDSEGDGDAHLDQQPASQENGDAAGYSLPSDVASRRIPRPSSARPAPPPVKRQESYTDLAQSERMSSAKPLAPVIMDGKRLSEDEDEQFVIEAVPPPPDAPVMQEPAHNLDSEDKHGGLVKKILETKKDYEASYKFKQNVVSEAAQKTERDMVTKEMEQLCSSIQMVCSSTMALGNGMNYVQEDVDAMQAELNTWRQTNQEYAQVLLEEQRETDRVLDPLQAELAELELLIKKEQEKIYSSKANILKNEDKIEKMMRMTFSPGS